MLKFKLQYFGHLMQRADSLEKTLMLGKTEGRRRLGRQRMRWMNGITNSWSLLKLMSTALVMPSNHLILCHTLLLLPSIFPSIRVFSNESLFASGGQSIGASTSASVLPMTMQDRFPLGLTSLISLLSERLSRVFSSTTIRKNQFFGAQPSLFPTLISIHD